MDGPGCAGVGWRGGLPSKHGAGGDGQGQECVNGMGKGGWWISRTWDGGLCGGMACVFGFRRTGAKVLSDDVHDYVDIASSITPLVSSSARALAVGVVARGPTPDPTSRIPLTLPGQDRQAVQGRLHHLARCAQARRLPAYRQVPRREHDHRCDQGERGFGRRRARRAVSCPSGVLIPCRASSTRCASSTPISPSTPSPTTTARPSRSVTSVRVVAIFVRTTTSSSTYALT